MYIYCVYYLVTLGGSTARACFNLSNFDAADDFTASEVVGRGSNSFGTYIYINIYIRMTYIHM